MTRIKTVLGLSAALVLSAGMSVAAQAPKPKPAPAKPVAAAQTAAPATPAAGQKHDAPAAKAAKPATATTASKVTKPAVKTKPAQVAKVDKAATTKPAKTAKAEKTAATARPVKTAKVEKTAATARPVKTAKVEKAEKSDKPAKSAKNKSGTTASKKAVAVAAATPAVPLTPVQEKLKKNANLATKVLWRLPPNTDLMAAASGFQDLGQFVAAVNVASNLNMSFDQVKAKMIAGKMPLAAAIQAVRTVASPTIEVQNAEYQARGMISESEQDQAASPATAPAAKVKSRKPAGS